MSGRLSGIACFAALLPLLPAQQLSPGFESTVHALPSSAGNVLVLPGDHYAWFDGFDLWFDAPGQPSRSLLHFANYTYGSFTLDVGNQQVLFGESSSHSLWLVSTAPNGTAVPAATVPYNFDAVWFRPDEVLVSAKTLGWGAPDNDVIHADLRTGNTQLLARLPGASGPVAIAPNGDLLYATGSLLWPMPPGQVDLLRFPRAVVDQALATQQVLGVGQAQVVFGALDAAGSLSCDDHGNVLFTDWYNDAVGIVHDAFGPAPWRSDLLLHNGASVSAAGVQFAPGGGYGVLAPFQPANGALYVRESAWGSASQVRRIVAARPTLTSPVPNPIPAGPFTLDVTRGPAAGFGLVAVAFTSSAPAPLAIAGFRQPLWWELPLAGALAAWVVPFDAAGQAQMALQNPGASPAVTFAAQVAFLDAAGSVVGSTGSCVLQLGP